MLVTSPDEEQPQVQDTTLKLQDVIAAARPNLSDAEYQKLEQLLTEYGDIFAKKTSDYKWTERVYHCIFGRGPTGSPNPEVDPPRETGRSR
jgi:hypothetical protein